MIRVYLNRYQLALAQQIAQARSTLHVDHASSRPLSPDYELIGIAGEIAFASLYLLPVDMTARAGGDQGKDFITRAGIIDIKTAAKPKWLFLERDHPTCAQLLVLAGWRTYWVDFFGWEYVEMMLKCPLGEFGGSRIINHYLAAGLLRPMLELEGLMLHGSG